MSSYNRKSKVLRLTRAELAVLLSDDRTRLRPNAPLRLVMPYKLADLVLCAGRIVKARRPWDAVGRDVPSGHGDVKVAIGRVLADDEASERWAA